MEESDVLEILKIILERIENIKFVWRLEGSANLVVQGIDLSIRDLDITTNYEGIEIFRRVLSDFIIKDFYSEKIEGLSLIGDINGFEIEINSFEDNKKGMFDKIEIKEWNGLKFPILPLKCAKEFYKLIDRDEKVRIIEEYLNGQNH